MLVMVSVVARSVVSVSVVYLRSDDEMHVE